MSQDNGAHIEDGATTDASLASRAKNPKKNGPKWWLISLIAVIVAVAVVIGVTLAFGGKKDDKSASSSNQYADTVTIGLKLAPTNLDIRNTAGSALDQILIGNVYEGIVARDSKNQVAPAIASSWETSKDGLTYTFHLNKNMTFSNGDKLDAEDVAWSINELIAKGYHDADALAAVSKVEAKDADTAVLTLKTPNSNLLWTLTGRAGLVFDKDAKYDLKTQAVGSGPYTVAKFVENSSITLKANEKYWGKNKAKTPTVVVKYLADDNAAVNALKSGDVQVLAPITEKHGTEQLAGLQAGDTVDVLGPLGRGFNLKEDANYILVGGGLGVPPLIYAAQKLAEHDASFATAVFGYRNDHFAEEYVSRYADWSWSIDDAEGNVVDLLNKLEQGDDLKAYDRKPIILSCGPLPMMKAVADWAAERGIPAQLSMEQRMGCGYGTCVLCTIDTVDGRLKVCSDGPVFTREQLGWGK